jgi:hypothetical protein
MPFPVTPRYFLNFRNSDTGLTPSFLSFKNATTFANIAGPSIIESPAGGGTYYFDWTWTTTADADIVFEVDGGASIPTEEVRYIKGALSPRDRFLDEPISQVVTDVWNDVANRAVGTKGDFVEHIGIDTDAVNAATVFGQVYKARDVVMGGTGFGGTGVDVKTVKDTIGAPTDTAASATVFGKEYLIRDQIMGGTGFGGTGVDVKTTYDRVGAPLGGFTNIADQIGDPSGTNSIAQDIAAIQSVGNTINSKIGTPVGTVSTDISGVQSTANTINTKIGTPTAADLATDITNVRGAGWVSTDNLHEIKVAVDAINVETDPASIANAVWNELITGHQTANSMGRFLNDVFRLLKNKAVINTTTKQLEVYDDAGAAVVFTFDLKDDLGVASATKIFRRLPL